MAFPTPEYYATAPKNNKIKYKNDDIKYIFILILFFLNRIENDDKVCKKFG